MAKKHPMKRDKTHYIPSPEERTVFSINVEPGQAITVNGPAVILCKEYKGNETRMAVYALPEVVITHMKDVTPLETDYQE